MNNFENSKPKVLIAVSHYWPSIGGLETVSGQLAEHLVASGYDVSVITAAYPERSADVHNGVKIISCTNNRDNKGLPRIFKKLSFIWPSIRTKIKGYPDWLVMLRNEVLSGRYKACILMQDPLGEIIWALEGAKIQNDTKLIIQPIINTDGYSKWAANNKFKRRLVKILHEADATVTMTCSGPDSQFMGNNDIRHYYIPNAVETTSSDGSDFRKQFGIKDSAFMILHVANLYRVKNHLGLLKVMESAPPEWQLVMIGHPSGEPDYVTEFYSQLCKHPNVIYIPGLDKHAVASAIAHADVVVLASHGEGSPVTILEAMSNKKPWIATPQCGAVNDNAGGIVCDLDKFPTYLRVLRENPDIAMAFGEIGFSHWKVSYSWDVVIEGWKDIIENGSLRRTFSKPESIDVQMENILNKIDLLALRLPHSFIQ